MTTFMQTTYRSGRGASALVKYMDRETGADDLLNYMNREDTPPFAPRMVSHSRTANAKRSYKRVSATSSFATLSSRRRTARTSRHAS